MKTQILRLRTHGKNRRVLLDNADLLKESGFTYNSMYNLFYCPRLQSIDLILNDEGFKRVDKKFNRTDIPVIDLNTPKMGWTLGDVKRIKVEYKRGKITLRGAWKDTSKEETANREWGNEYISSA